MQAIQRHCLQRYRGIGVGEWGESMGMGTISYVLDITN